MHRRLIQLLPQPLIGAMTSLVALGLLVASWTMGPYRGVSADTSAPLISLFLVVSVVLAYRFPIHIRRDTKVYMASVPLYLIACLLLPPLAATTAALGVLTSQLNIRSLRGGYISDVATETGRWTAIVLLGSVVAHLPGGSTALPVVGAAAAMWLGDVITCPLVLAPISGEPPLRIIVTVVREAGVAEAVQYLVGLLGVLAAQQRIWALGLLFMPTALVYVAFKNAKEIHDTTLQLLESMADTVDLRDPHTGGHSRRVASLTQLILRQLGMRGPETELIVSAARIHDIGKIGVPDYVLHKSGSLTPEERQIMEMHAEHGANVLKRYPDFARGVEIVRHHHERWDGHGYPQGLKATEIPFGARVVAVADSFDAMTSDRPYRRALSADRAAAILRDGRAVQWDPAIVDAFLVAVADRLEGAERPSLRVVGDATGEGPGALA